MLPETSAGLPDYLEILCDNWELVGSRITCNPPPTDTDQDILCLVLPKHLHIFLEELEANKWKQCTGKKDETDDEPDIKDFDTFKEYSIAYKEWKEEHNTNYGTLADGAAFASWRLGELNIILTQDEQWYDKFIEASECCKALNVMDKTERCRIFGTIVPKQLPEPVPKLLTETTPFNSLVELLSAQN
jgi:hypothetical protein